MEVKHCLYCGKEIPKIKIDTLGRRTTKTSNFCNNKSYCRNAYVYTVKHPNYMKEYYLNNKEKYVNRKSKGELIG